MQKIIFTGNGSISMALAAAATASAAAKEGQRTLLASIGPSHNLSALLGVPISDEPQSIAPNLDAWEHNTLNRMSNYLESIRPNLSGILAQLSGEELPTLPGLDLFLSLDYLQKRAALEYDLIVVDAGTQDALLRALSIPDGFRWIIRLIFGLDREPGRNMDTVYRALLPVNLLPFESINKIQDIRVGLEMLRNRAIDETITTARYVLQPDQIALNEAFVAVPALQLHGLTVDAIVVGPLLPKDITDARFHTMVNHQQEMIAQAEQTWSPRPILQLAYHTPVCGIATITTMGQHLYAQHQPHKIAKISRPIEFGDDSDPFVAFRLPGLPRNALSLTLSGDELIVRAGPYRRHILLPTSLRATSQVRASREGERVIVRLRK